jgi:hypothetical protein
MWLNIYQWRLEKGISPLQSPRNVLSTSTLFPLEVTLRTHCQPICLWPAEYALLASLVAPAATARRRRFDGSLVTPSSPGEPHQNHWDLWMFIIHSPKNGIDR